MVPNRRRIFSRRRWSIGATRSLLGASLIALARYQEAEDVLVQARSHLDASSPPPWRDIDATIARFVDLDSVGQTRRGRALSGAAR
jgi:hypothetical protein